MKILLLSSFFYPDEHIGATRWNRYAKYFLRDGHELYVIALDNGANYKHSANCTGIKRVNSQSSLPDRLLKRISSAKKGLGIEKERQSYSVKPKNHIVAAYSRVVKLLGRLARFPSVYWWSAHEMVRAGIDIINSKQIDIIIATHPFPCCLRAAYVISARTGIRWVADMRDGWSSYYYGEYLPGSFLNKILIVVEKFYLRKAAKVVATNVKMASTIHANRVDVEAIHSGFDPEEVAPYSDNHSNTKSLVFDYVGSIHDDNCWDIFFSGLAACLSEMKDIKLIINYYGELFEKLRAYGIASGIPSDAFIDHGYVGKEQLHHELRKADLLVVLGFRGPFGDTVINGKIYDYIEAGRPIIVVGPTTSAVALTVAETETGFIVSNVEDMKSLVLDLLKDKAAVLDRIVAKRRAAAFIKHSAAEAVITYTKLLNEVVGGCHRNQHS